MHTFDNSNISLDEEEYKYILSGKPNVKFISCTTLVSQFFREFDAYKIALKLTSFHTKYNHMDPEELVEEWNKARDDGTRAHKEIEEYLINGKKPGLKKSKTGVKWLKNNIGSASKVYPELIVYSEDLGIAGTVDLLIYNPATNCYDMFDWKTNKSIEMNSYGGQKGTKPATVHLPDCNFYHYSLQLSIYKYLLENYHNIKIGELTILNLQNTEVIPYRCEYLISTVEKILKSFNRL
jgi:hypothetical protein